MANLVVFLLPLAVTAQISPWTIEPILISGKGGEVCTSLEQQKSAKELLLDQISSMLSLEYFLIDQCGDGLWYKLVSINMSDPVSQCPQGWAEESIGGVRGCGRGTVPDGCQSTFLSSDDLHYTKVCGRAIGYQHGSTDAFLESMGQTIDEIHVDGLSITYGMPGQHVWTYAAGLSEIPIIEPWGLWVSSNCPCSSPPGTSPPSFVGDNWYCESGFPDPVIPSEDVFLDDPLWDGEDCEDTCCSNGKSPPWFSVELPGPTNDLIEARLCGSDDHDKVFIKIFEVYVQ